MTRTGNVIGLGILLAVASLAGYAAWRMRAPAVAACDICSRPMHERSKAVGIVDGKKRTFCCPACALTARRQLKGSVEVVELTDYVTNTPLDPAKAYIVVGSNTNHCVHQRNVLDSERMPSTLDFDRCSPSMNAFSARGDAEEFQRLHGGDLELFVEIAGSYQR